jgi:hypothetical protein
MSNYEANPVGFLFERYQSSGVSPLYEVVMTQGQAHAPIFTARLTVPQGHTVEATGSSKKIARNLAAKLMLDKLEEVEGQSKLVQNTKTKIINVNNNYVKKPQQLDTYGANMAMIPKPEPRRVGTEVARDPAGGSGIQQLEPPSHGGLEGTEEVKVDGKTEEEKYDEKNSISNEAELERAEDGTMQAQGNAVARFYLSMRQRGGAELEELLRLDLMAGGWELDCCSVLGRLAAEQGCGVVYREVRGQHGEREKGLGMVQVAAPGDACHTVCLGEGSDPGQARQAAARAALVYIQQMTKPAGQEAVADPHIQ